MAMPAKTAFAGGNGCRKTDSSLRTVLTERVYRTSTEDLSDFISFPSSPLNCKRS
ncbi:hypothetical protein BJV77DRAFT_991313, partial [Russula vinacea]